MRKQLQTNTLVFILWIGLAIVIHFALTCAIIHPVEVKLPITMLEQNDSSVEAYLVKTKKSPTPACSEKTAKETPSILNNTHSTVTESVREALPLREEHAEQQNTHLADPHVDSAPPDALASQSNHFLENTLINEGNFLAEAQGVRNKMAPASVKSPAPRYPMKAKNEGRSGTTQLRVTIDASGRPTDVGVENSSGHPDLDERARDTVIQRWRFTPPQDSRLTKMTFLVEIEFKLTA
jgi:TonB family protein